MNAAALERDAFAPQQPPGMRSGLALAILAHALLIAALAWSVHWKASEPEGVVAELWSALPQTAAPRAAPPEPRPPVVEPRPTPPPPPPTPAVPVKPAPVVKPEPAPPPRADAQIAIEKAARERAAREEAERAEAARQAEIRKRDQARREEAKREEAKRDEAKRAEAKRQADERERQRLADEQAEKKKLAEQAKKEEARQAAIREANLRRMMKEAGSGDEASTGTAARTSGPSSGYAGRIKARVKPNIVLTAPLDGNPSATVEVRVAPDGTIVGRKLVASSGSALWDETVLRAIDKTEVLPKDVDGRVPPTITIAFKPRE